MNRSERLLTIGLISLAVVMAVAVTGGVIWNLGEPARIAEAKAEAEAAAEAAAKAEEESRQKALRDAEIARQKADAAAKLAALQEKARLPTYTVAQLENGDVQKLRGKWYAVRGKVVSSGPGMVNPYVKLEKDGLFSFCCNFDKEDEQEVHKVRKSQVVTIAGIGEGTFNLGQCFFYNINDPESILARLEIAKRREAVRVADAKARDAEIATANMRPKPRVTWVDPTQRIPGYEVLDETKLSDGSGEICVEVLVESLSRATPVAERERIARVIAARQSTTYVLLYCTRIAMKANYSLKAKNANPGALEDGFLGEFRHNKFTLIYPLKD